MKKALSLIEVLVSIAIFSVVSVVALNIYINNIKQSEQTKQFNVFLNEARFLREFLVNKLEVSEIDHSEYFEQCVIKSNCPLVNGRNLAPNIEYAEFDQIYNLQFLNFGNKPDGTDDNYGKLCIDQQGRVFEMPTDNCQVVFAGSEDTPTGENNDLNATCSNNNIVVPSWIGDGESKVSNRDCNQNTNIFNKLFLKDANGNKLIFGIKEFEGSNILSMAILNLDLEVINQLPQTYQTFKCAPFFNCNENSKLTNSEFTATNLNELYKGAVPISSLNLNIKEFSVEFGPHQDLELASNQQTQEVQQAPFVHIKFFVEPKSDFILPFTNKAASIPVEIFHVFDI